MSLTEAGEWFVPQARMALDQFGSILIGSNRWQRGMIGYRVRLNVEPYGAGDSSLSKNGLQVANMQGEMPPSWS